MKIKNTSRPSPITRARPSPPPSRSHFSSPFSVLPHPRSLFSSRPRRDGASCPSCGHRSTELMLDFQSLRRKLKKLMLDFQSLRRKTMAEYKETVERQYFTVMGEYPNEEVIEKIISSGEREDLLHKAIAEHGRGKVLATVCEIQDRHDAAKEMEKSLVELHQVFLDMAVMVEAQGEQMDDIEHHVSSASSYVAEGTNKLRSAKKYQKSSRKWMCIGVILLLILILVIIIPIATSLSSS